MQQCTDRLNTRKYNRYTQDVMQDILVLHKMGLSSREISRTLFGLETKKSTINNILNRGVNGVPRGTYKLEKSLPRILFIDFETLPSTAVVFGRFNLNLSPRHIIEEGNQILSASWCYLNDDEVTGVVMSKNEAINRDDSRVLACVYEVIQNSDIVVAQNGDRFDIPLFKTRCIVNNFLPTKRFKTIDTLKIAKQLKFDSNSLESVASALGLGSKLPHTGIKLWIDCMNGNEKALQKMLEYNRQDVRLLREVYLKLRAYDSRHPNLALYFDDEKIRCPACGSEDVHETGNSVFTSLSEFKEMTCYDCGHNSRTRINISSKNKRKNTLMI